MNIIFKILRYLKKHSNLIRDVIVIVLAVLIIVMSVMMSKYKSSYTEEVQLNRENKSTIKSLQDDNENLKSQIEEHKISNQEKDSQIKELEEQVQDLKKTSLKLMSNNKEAIVADGNYNQAEYIWNQLKSTGLNDFVCAGILGNIMAEVGGHTLDISLWPKYSKNSYYGICQWAGNRKERLLRDFGVTLEAQVNFLIVEISEVFKEGSSFYTMQDEREAALYFAKYYERCNSRYYTVRQTNATRALKYFTQSSI